MVKNNKKEGTPHMLPGAGKGKTGVYN